jgi:hypothetical protein
MALNYKTNMYDEQGRTWKEVVMAYFTEPSQHMH